MPKELHLSPVRIRAVAKAAVAQLVERCSFNIVAAIYKKVFGECRWNYITFNEEVAGSNPARGVNVPL